MIFWSFDLMLNVSASIVYAWHAMRIRADDTKWCNAPSNFSSYVCKFANIRQHRAFVGATCVSDEQVALQALDLDRSAMYGCGVMSKAEEYFVAEKQRDSNWSNRSSFEYMIRIFGTMMYGFRHTSHLIALCRLTKECFWIAITILVSSTFHYSHAHYTHTYHDI